MNNYEIQAIPTSKTEIKQCPGAESGCVPKHPFRNYIIGASGSGKTNLLLNLLSRGDFYNGYFDEVFIISPTASELDDSYKVLGLDQTHFFQPDVQVLQVIEDIQRKNIKRAGIAKAPKVCVILDDCISYKRFINSKILLKFAIMSRHYGISMFILSQCYHRVPKSVRLNMSCIMFFKGNMKEVETITDDFMCPGWKKKDFMGLINKSTNKRYNFFHIDMNKQIEEGRYKKNLNEVLIKGVYE